MKKSALAIILMMSGVAAIAEAGNDPATGVEAPDTSATSEATDSAAPAPATSDDNVADQATTAAPADVAEPGSVVPSSIVADSSALPAAPAPTLAAVVQPSNASPERDARGIAVISAEAVVPAGFNGISGGAAVGGPELDPATGEATALEPLPACSASVTDHCQQTYEKGVS